MFAADTAAQRGGDARILTAVSSYLEISGVVASWVGAVLTGGSAVLAARFYVSDRRREARAQAQQIRIVIIDLRPTLTALVSNYSDRAIYDIAIETRPMTLTEWFVYRKKSWRRMLKFDDALLADLRTKFSQVTKSTSVLLLKEERVLYPTDSVEITYPEMDAQAARFFIAFRDQMHRRCRLEFWPDDGGMGETRTRLTLSDDRGVADTGWDLIRHPVRERAAIRAALSIWWWEKRHKLSLPAR